VFCAETALRIWAALTGGAVFPWGGGAWDRTSCGWGDDAGRAWREVAPLGGHPENVAWASLAPCQSRMSSEEVVGVWRTPEILTATDNLPLRDAAI